MGLLQTGGRQVSDEEREYLNEMIRSLNNQLVDALRERDEARRRLCVLVDAYGDGTTFANKHGWDCFEQEDGK
jgi:uncharacterized membrane protein